MCAEGWEKNDDLHQLMNIIWQGERWGCSTDEAAVLSMYAAFASVDTFIHTPLLAVCLVRHLSSMKWIGVLLQSLTLQTWLLATSNARVVSPRKVVTPRKIEWTTYFHYCASAFMKFMTALSFIAFFHLSILSLSVAQQGNQRQ